jgi:hypothetical protein
MVAAGNDQGIVTVFQIPKIPPDSLPESMKPKKNKQVCCNIILQPFLSLEFVKKSSGFSEDWYLICAIL